MKKLFLILFLFLFSFTKVNAYEDYVNSFLTNTKSTISELNENYEFKGIDGNLYKMNSMNCIYLDSKNYINKSLQVKSFILKTNNGYCITSSLKQEKKVLFKDLKSINLSLPYFIENNRYKMAVFSSYLVLNDLNGYYPSEFENYGIKSDFLLLKDKGKFYIAKEYEIIDLFDKSLLDGISGKSKILKLLYEDIRKVGIENTKNIEKNMKSIKITSKMNSRNKTKDEIILSNYKYVSSKIKYYEGDISDLSKVNRKMFGGFTTFEGKKGVCDGYTKLFSYLLLFSGINNVEIKTGEIINSELYGKVGHAWNKIGTKYYDTTFESTLKNKNGLVYYGLPKNIMYIDRHEELKNGNNPYSGLSLKQREEEVKNKYKNLIIDKAYKIGDYLLLDLYQK